MVYHEMYAYKKKSKVHVWLYIVLSVMVPLIESAVPAMAVALLVNNDIGRYLVGIAAFVFFDILLNSILEYSEIWLREERIGARLEISGGEAQKIAIARALYKDASLVIMDEPTSALDPVSEDEIYRSFEKISKTKPRITISSSVNTITKMKERGGNIVLQRKRILCIASLRYCCISCFWCNLLESHREG